MNCDPLLKLVAEPGPVCGCCDLDDHAFCAGLTPEGLHSLRGIRGNSRYAAHEAVFGEGEPAEQVFALVKGTVKISKLLGDGRRQIVGFLFPGDFFGFGCDGLYPYSAETITPTALCRFSGPRLAELMSRTPELEHRLRERLVHELAFAQEQMLLLGRMTAREKVAHFILMLARRAERRGEPLSPVGVPMSRQDMADYLGLTIETVSRTLSAMKRDGLIGLQGTAVVDLHDIDRLRAIADGLSPA